MFLCIDVISSYFLTTASQVVILLENNYPGLDNKAIVKTSRITERRYDGLVQERRNSGALAFLHLPIDYVPQAKRTMDGVNHLSNHVTHRNIFAWWRHQLETFSALPAICAGIHRSPVNPGEFPTRMPVRCFFDLRPNKRLSKQSWGWWFETPSFPLCRHCHGYWEFAENHPNTVTSLWAR